MRREGRRRSDDNYSDKAIKYLVIAIIITSIIIIGILIYSNILKERTKKETITGEQISSILNKTIENKSAKEASSEIGKSVNESIKENNTLSTEKTSANSTKNNNIVSNKNAENSKSKTKEKTEEKKENKLNNEVKNVQTEKDKKSKEENKTELKFVKPVDGDIVRDFAKDSLIYSDTLDEWTTHMGIDIKADKTTIVKSAEKGTVKTIKNDPRYGLTIIIDHENGFQTVYSNLLTSEFVVEGEKVDKEQPIGTVGNTAAFEIADEPHLHFEIIKDNVTVDPNIYLQN